MKNALTAALLGLSAVILIGCGYRTDGLFRDDVSTVYVETFDTREFRRGIEFQLTEAIKKRISMNTPYRLASKEKADTILMGEVLEVRQSAFAPDPESRLPREIQLVLAVRLVWKDLRNGRMLADVPVQLDAVDYVPPTGETDQYAIEKSVDGIAQKVVGRMYADW